MRRAQCADINRLLSNITQLNLLSGRQSSKLAAVENEWRQTTRARNILLWVGFENFEIFSQTRLKFLEYQ